MIDISICRTKSQSQQYYKNKIYNNNQGANFNEHNLGQSYQILFFFFYSHYTNANRQNVEVNNVMNQHAVGQMPGKNAFNSNKTNQNNQKNS